MTLLRTSRLLVLTFAAFLPAPSVAGGVAGAVPEGTRVPQQVTARSGLPATTAWVSTWDGFLTPIDTNTDVVGTRIRIGASGSGALAISPDGSTAYVSPGRGRAIDKSITPVSLGTGVVGRPIRTGAPVGAVVVTPDGTTAYTVDSDARRVTPIDLRTRKTAAPIRVGIYAGSIVVSPNGRIVYVANSGDGTVTAIDTKTNKAKALIRLGGHPYDLAVSPDGSTLYVTNYTAVVAVDTATNTRRSTTHVPSGALGIALTPNGRAAYVVAGGAVTPIDLASKRVGTPIRVTGNPLRIVITPDGATAYAFGDTVTPIDLTTGTAGARIGGFGLFGAANMAIVRGHGPVPKRGYYLVASDGGVFAFGTARFYGSTGAMKLNSSDCGHG